VAFYALCACGLLDNLVTSGYNEGAQGTSERSARFSGGMKMTRKLTTAAIIATIGACSAANAQVSNQLNTSPNNITIRGGIALPADSSLSNVSSTFTNLGFEYQFGDSLFKGGDTFLSVDAFFNNFDHVVAWPIAVNQRFYTGTNAAGHRSYYFIGVGMTFLNVTTSGGAIAARGGLGTELGPNIVAELGGYISDRAEGARGNAVTFNIGYRF